jgi:hypothetical protein
MILGFYVPISIFVILWPVSRLSEANYQLDQAQRDRDSFARSLATRFRRRTAIQSTNGRAMNEPVPAMAPSIQADALAARLTRKGLVTNVYKSRGHLRHPCVRVASSPSPHAAIVEYIYAAPDGQQWWFWWSSLEPIEPITEVDATIDRIVATLGFPR